MKAMTNYNITKNIRYGYFEVKPTPSADEINRYYLEEFYSGDYPRLNDSRLEVQQKDKEYWDLCRKTMCDKIEDLLGRSLSELSILDIGCGWGETLSYMKDKGADVFGFDPALDAVDYVKSKGIGALHCDMGSFEGFTRRFDVVIMQNVLEHLANPDQVLNKISQQLISKGGLLVVDVPNEFNKLQVVGQSKHALDEWWVCPPVHLNYFSHESLSAVVVAQGFSVSYLTSSFPIEMFLLFGDQYVDNAEIGRHCHERRMAFELALLKTSNEKLLQQFNESMAAMGLGRQILLYAQKSAAEGEV